MQTTAAKGSSFRAGLAALLANERLFIFLTLAPALLLLGVYIFFPILWSLYLSFFKTRLYNIVEFVGFTNYQAVLENPVFASALWNTLVYCAASVVLTIVLGLAAALLLARPLRGQNAFRAVLFLPYIVPYAAYALLWHWLFDPRYGLVNYLLGFVGIDPIAWLRSRDWVIPAFVIMSVWKRLGFAMVLFLAGMQTIPRDLYDAADIDGAGRWHKFWYVTLPMLRPITLFVAVISLIYSLQLFVEPLVMTHGGPGNSSQSLSYLLYQQAFMNLNIGLASVTAVILCVLTFGLTFVLLRRFDIRDIYK